MRLDELILLFKSNNMELEQSIARLLFKASMTVSVAESCTGGLVSSRLTDVSGSSNYITENYVTYANESKMKLLGVKEETLKKHGAVSEECAREMAEGLFKKLESSGAGCDIALSTTGIAGPTGAIEGKNVGLMFMAIKSKTIIKVRKVELNPKLQRKTMKYLFSQKALEFLNEFLSEKENF